MQSKIFSSYNKMCRFVAEMATECAIRKPNALFCLAAGNTSLGVFRHMIRLQDKGKADFRNCRFIGLDEWLGLGSGDDGSMIDFMHNHLFEPLRTDERKVVFFNGKADPEKECKRIEAYLRSEGPVDFLLLGAGMNGHLGLNEPGTPFESRTHAVHLDPTTKTVAQKYFKKTTALTGGITLGMHNIKEAGQVVLMVNGGHKSGLVQRFMEEAPSPGLPATFIKTLENAVFCYDRAAERPSDGR